jgi:hypothetical protein
MKRAFGQPESCWPTRVYQTQEAHMTLDDLHQHPLFEEAVHDSIAVQKALGLKLTDEFDERTTLDELQFYVTRVGFSLSHTLGWIQQLHRAVHFMTDFRYGKKNTDAGVNKSHHLLYNVENYLIRMVSVYDRCLQLTNAVFSHLYVRRSGEPQCHREQFARLTYSSTWTFEGGQESHRG